MGKQLTQTEKDARALLRKCRDMLTNQMDAYQDPSKFPIDSVVRAIAHGYSLLARLEKELEDLPSDEEYQELLAEIEASEEYDGKSVTVSAKAYEKLQRQLERADIWNRRVKLLKEIAKANRLLGQQLSEEQKVKEMQKRQKYIEVQTHASILAAYNDIFFLAMRRIGLSEIQIREFFEQVKQIEKNYPLVKMDIEDVIERLTVSPEKRMELEPANYTVEEDDPDKVIEAMEDTV